MNRYGEEDLILVRIRVSKDFRRAVSHHFGRKRIATDAEVTTWAEMCLDASAEDVVTDYVEGRMNKR